uniref:Uncharacterized protein n=1 Tax=Anguilla anguilla TaxID=7936 RepID=A0A0E9PQ49_ANGAN
MSTCLTFECLFSLKKTSCISVIL